MLGAAGRCSFPRTPPTSSTARNWKRFTGLVKKDGFTTVRRASESELLRKLAAEGDLPGALWKQGLFEGAGLK
jgi:hypothetical protein